MPKTPPHNFHLRLPDDVMSFLQQEKGDNSLNSEIVSRLRGSMAAKDADDLGQALRPVLDGLDADDRKELVAIAIRALTILSKADRAR